MIPRLVLSPQYIGPDRRERAWWARLTPGHVRSSPVRSAVRGGGRGRGGHGGDGLGPAGRFGRIPVDAGLEAGRRTVDRLPRDRRARTDAAAAPPSARPPGRTLSESDPTPHHGGPGVDHPPESDPGARGGRCGSGGDGAGGRHRRRRPPATTVPPAPAATTADLTPAQMGAQALALVRYPWQSIPGYSIQFLPIADAPSPGFYGNTTFTWGQAGGTSVLYVYPG